MVRETKAVEFVQRVQTYLTQRGVHPDINIDVLRRQLHDGRVKQAIVEETVDGRLEKDQWKHDFIAGPDSYVYFMARWRRLYVKTANGYSTDLTDVDPCYVRTGNGGTEYVKLSFDVLRGVKHGPTGDKRIRYE